MAVSKKEMDEFYKVLREQFTPEEIEQAEQVVLVKEVA